MEYLTKSFTSAVLLFSASLSLAGSSVAGKITPAATTTPPQHLRLQTLLKKKKEEHFHLIQAMTKPENKSNRALGKRLRELLLEISDLEKELKTGALQ